MLYQLWKKHFQHFFLHRFHLVFFLVINCNLLLYSPGVFIGNFSETDPIWITISYRQFCSASATLIAGNKKFFTVNNRYKLPTRWHIFHVKTLSYLCWKTSFHFEVFESFQKKCFLLTYYHLVSMLRMNWIFFCSLRSSFQQFLPHLSSSRVRPEILSKISRLSHFIQKGWTLECSNKFCNPSIASVASCFFPKKFNEALTKF